MNKEILSFCFEKGLLLDEEVLSLFSEANDFESVKMIIEKIKDTTQQKIITKKVFDENPEQVKKVFSGLPVERQRKLEKLKIKLGLSIEISKEQISDFKLSDESIKSEQGVTKTTLEKNEIPNSQIEISEIENKEKIVEEISEVKVKNSATCFDKKIVVNDFVKHFRSRFVEMQKILQEHSELNNLISINKISGNQQGVSVIGIVSDKKITKNKNIFLEIEDLTGKIRVLINKNKPELYERAGEITLDAVIGFKCSGNREILFVNEIVFPDSFLHERKKSLSEEYALFIGDLHFGSKLFLEKNFLKFIDYLNGKIPDTPEVATIKYLFIVGDLITGVGNYPGQEKDLGIIDIEEQFSEIAGLLGKIRKDIQIIISPGNHDGVRLMEPQPMIDEKYAWPLYNLKNVTLTGNPARINIGSKKDFSGFDVLTYHGFSFPFYANNISKLMLKRAMNTPEKIMKYLLKNRHLAPTHGSTQYFPLEDDALAIKKTPDIFVSAHTHKSAVSYYNNVLVISTSCWESMTPYQEKFGNKPDHCKVPMFNLKTRAVKILDFE